MSHACTLHNDSGIIRGFSVRAPGKKKVSLGSILRAFSLYVRCIWMLPGVFLIELHSIRAVVQIFFCFDPGRNRGVAAARSAAGTGETSFLSLLSS